MYVRDVSLQKYNFDYLLNIYKGEYFFFSCYVNDNIYQEIVLFRS